MKKRILEESFANIDDKYIVEALDYKKEKGRVISFPHSRGTLSKAAAIFLIVLCVGTVSTVVAASVKKLFFTEHTAYVGELDFDPEEASKGLYDEDIEENDSFYMDVDEVVYGDATVQWSIKWKLSHEDLVEYEYDYDTYEAAVTDGEFHKWFDTLPGEQRRVYIGTQNFEIEEAKKKFIRLNAGYCYKGKMYYIEQQKWLGDDDFFISFYDNKQNEREYINKAGIKFMLVDDVREGFAPGEKYIYTDTIILDGNIKGRVLFENMSEEDIHEVLEHFTANNEAVE